ncbi:amidase family protein [Geodermatophilus sabuli]|uniref:Amidase n=1 Tax=Geodermatophilus sabuli TaxID=1564158 RepID=A0A285EGH1_9ACTN|nr:amidase family protein [Geodermatophilus sabuli]MBB3084511.1 amidase [Geodermatophilus sabuli]SNX97294.1 amidase [Geodermatophilus sabuli]
MTVIANDPTPGSDDLWRWSATQLAHGIATGQVSAREVVQSCLDRIDAVNPRLNALIEVRPEEALEAADAADRETASGAELGPLHGVPVAIKVNSDQVGHATTNGVAAFKDNVASTDSPHVANLRQSGAILLGRSNTPAFSYRWFTNNDLHGRTLNPWDAARTPGGSSGGASSAVASGMVPIAHGNDIGGSVRYPAYACGVVGLRPTVGRVAGLYGPEGADPALSVQSMLVQGPLARSVADTRLALRGMTGADPRDPFHVPGAPAAPAAERPFRIAVVRDHGVATPTPAVDDALDRAASWLGDAGYVVEEVELPLLAEAYRLWYLLCMEEFRQIMPLVEEVGDEGMKKAAEGYYAVSAEWWGERPGLTDYMNGYARRGTLIRQLGEFMQRFSTVLLPVSAEQAFEQDADIASVESMRRVMAAQASMMAIPVLGFPALSVPTGITDGLPAGVQLLGRRFGEDGILDAAEVIEARAGTFTPIDPH